jgi:hypothetical protein
MPRKRRKKKDEGVDVGQIILFFIGVLYLAAKIFTPLIEKKINKDLDLDKVL